MIFHDFSSVPWPIFLVAITETGCVPHPALISGRQMSARASTASIFLVAITKRLTALFVLPELYRNTKPFAISLSVIQSAIYPDCPKVPALKTSVNPPLIGQQILHAL